MHPWYLDLFVCCILSILGNCGSLTRIFFSILMSAQTISVSFYVSCVIKSVHTRIPNYFPCNDGVVGLQNRNRKTDHSSINLVYEIFRKEAGELVQSLLSVTGRCVMWRRVRAIIKDMCIYQFHIFCWSLYFP